MSLTSCHCSTPQRILLSPPVVENYITGESGVKVGLYINGRTEIRDLGLDDPITRGTELQDAIKAVVNMIFPPLSSRWTLSRTFPLNNANNPLTTK